MEHDALGAHARDELGLSEMHAAKPIQAGLASAATFAVGAALPLLMVVISPISALVPMVAGSSLIFLTLMGALAARAGGANVWIGAGRVVPSLFFGCYSLLICRLAHGRRQEPDDAPRGGYPERHGQEGGSRTPSHALW